MMRTIDIYLPEIFHFLNVFFKLDNTLRFEFRTRNQNIYTFYAELAEDKPYVMFDLHELSQDIETNRVDLDDVRTSLIQAGILELRNSEKIGELINRASSWQPVIFLFDTNDFILRVVSNIFYPLSKKKEGLKNISLYVSPLILDELMHIISGVNKQEMIKSPKCLRAIVGIREFSFHYSNKLIKYTLKSHTGGLYTKKLGDKAIMEDYYSFLESTREKNYSFFFIGADARFVSWFRSLGVESIYLDQELEILPFIKRPIYVLPQVVYIFATNFLELKVSSIEAPFKLKFRIYKKSYVSEDPWVLVQLDISQQMSPGLSDTLYNLEREFRLLRKLRELRGELDELY